MKKWLFLVLFAFGFLAGCDIMDQDVVIYPGDPPKDEEQTPEEEPEP